MVLARIGKRGKGHGLSSRQSQRFRRIVLQYYHEEGRILPWRRTRDPYRILVSEIMLQQTQVPRVLGKYREFLGAFPNLRALAGARRADVLRVWQGLGYNRRAVALKKTAEIIAERHGGRIPSDAHTLRALPGIGTATAAAIRAFAFNLPAVLIETNIRSVFLHHFFSGCTRVKDAQILPLVVQTLDKENPREWYYALMDYGVFLKQQNPNPGRRSAAYTKQSPFEGSARQIRGTILRVILKEGSAKLSRLAGEVGVDKGEMRTLVDRMVREGLIFRTGSSLTV